MYTPPWPPPLTYTVALHSIRVTDAQDNEVLAVDVQKAPGNRVTATSEGKRPIEFVQVPPDHRNQLALGS